MFWFALLGGILIPAGVSLVWRGVRGLWPGRSATSWPRVWGVVTASRLREPAGTDEAEYTVDIEYRYRVNGVTYTASDFRDGANNLTEPRAEAEYRAGLYPVGRRTLVSYNPTEPWVAVLEPHDRSGVYSLLASGTFLIAVGVWLIL